jgi:hypothetical protein
MICEPTEHNPAKANLSAVTGANTTPIILPYQTSAGGAYTMNNSELQYCLNMARCLDEEATRTREDSYLRMLLQEQAAKYRAVAGDNRPLTVE